LQGLDYAQDLLACSIAKQGNAATVQLLVQWRGHSSEKATWHFATDIENKIPAFAQSL